jgi:25S rRNA (uracil2634-N3)-methyltransferase
MPNKKAPKGRDLKKAKAKAGQIAKADHKRRVKLGLDTGKKTKKPPPVKPVVLPKRQSTQALIRDPSRRVLLVGEGNFSFALALLRLRNQQPGVDRGELPSGANLTATGFDSESTVLQKYPDAVDILRELDEAHVRVLHEVDATDIQRRVSSIVPARCVVHHGDEFYCVGSDRQWQEGHGPSRFRQAIRSDYLQFPSCGQGDQG